MGYGKKGAKREYRFTVDATLNADDALDALDQIAKHFQAKADRLQYGDDDVRVPNTFGYNSNIRIMPIERVVQESGDNIYA